MLFPLIVSSCDKDFFEVEIHQRESGGDEEMDSDMAEDSLILNFLGDSIIDYWENVSDFFPDYNCRNYGWSTKGIDTFLGRVDILSLVDTECVIEIGTNDMKRVINSSSIDSYIEHYVDVLISLDAKRIYLLSLLPRNRAKDGGFDYNKHYPEINTKIEKRVSERMDNVIYIPLYDLFIKEGQINWEYTYDGLHPNKTGYEVMAKAINNYLIK
jgi:hypothetical protein